MSKNNIERELLHAWYAVNDMRIEQARALQLSLVARNGEWLIIDQHGNYTPTDSSNSAGRNRELRAWQKRPAEWLGMFNF